MRFYGRLCNFDTSYAKSQSFSLDVTWRISNAYYTRLNMAAAKQLKCLVTGGASGLGRATVQRLIQKHGAKAVILDLPSSNGEKVADEIGRDCYFCPTDVSAVYAWTLNSVIAR